MDLVSLIPFERFSRGLIPIELRCDQLDSVSFLKQNIVKVRGTSAELTQERIEFLEKKKFLRAVSNICQLIEISSFQNETSFLKSLPPKRRSLVRQMLRFFEENGCEMKISKLKEIDCQKISSFFTHVVFPACSFRSINPYNVLNAPHYHSFLSSFGEGKSIRYFLELRMKGQIVAGGIANVTDVSNWVKDCCKKKLGATSIWEKPLNKDATIFDLKLAHSHPTAGGEKFGPNINRLLYWFSILWAIQNGIFYFSGGAEDREFLPDDYLGVIYFKKLWGMSSAVFSQEKDILYLYMPEELFLGAKRNALIPHFTKDQKVQLKYLVANGAQEDRIHAFLSSDSHFEKEIVVANKQDEKIIHTYLEEKGLKAKIRFFDWGRM